MIRHLTSAALVVAVTLLSASGWPDTAGEATAAGVRPVRRITMKYEFLNGYRPAEITVTKGTKIIWRNTDTVDRLSHTVTRRTISGGPGAHFDSGRVRPGQTYERVFNRIGTFRYQCTFHDHMRAKITVVSP